MDVHKVQHERQKEASQSEAGATMKNVPSSVVKLAHILDKQADRYVKQCQS